MNEMRPAPFVIFMPGRTGSSYLVSCLKRHSQIAIEGERLVGIKNAAAQMEWMNKFYGQWRFRKKAVGFKTKLKDVGDQEGLRDLLNRMNVKVVIALRHDIVRQAISVLNARKLIELHGVWNRNSATPELGKLVVDTEQLVREIEEVEKRNQELDAFNQTIQSPKLTLYYEDLCASCDTELQRVQQFLGVTPRRLEGRTLKSTPDNLRDALANYDEVVGRFEGTPYAKAISNL